MQMVFAICSKEKFQYIKVRKIKKLLRAHDECLGANRR